MPELGTFEGGGAGGLASRPSCESLCPYSRCVIAGYFSGLSELTRARRGIVVPNLHVMGSANTKREQSAAKGTFAVRASRDAATFCGGPRASVTVDRRPVGLSKLVRARRGVVALNAYAMGGASAKMVQSATKSTPAGHASDGAIDFRDGAGELQLEPCVPSGVMLRNDDGLNIKNVFASASVHRTPAETAAALFTPTKATARQRASVFVCTPPRQKNDAQTVSCDPRNLVQMCVVAKRACGRVRRC